jgi:hypothetical protein
MSHRTVLLMLCLTVPTAAAGGEDLRAEVRGLVRKLDAPQLAQREAAEAELLRRGPAILDLLPPSDGRESAEVEQRLGRIRQQLQRAAADAAAGASTITLNADSLPLSEVLRALTDQSGNAIVDCRRQFGQPASDPKLTISFERTPFWPALDQLLDRAGLTVYPYGQRQAVGLLAASDRQRPAAGRVSYSGPFRFEPLAVVARRDLRQTDGGSLTVAVEAAWEPRLRIISLAQPMAEVIATDERGQPLPVADRAAQPEVSVGGDVPAVKLELPLELPPRGVERIASLKGKVLATIPGRTETFRFGQLAEAKSVARRLAGVTVTLEQVRRSSFRPFGEGPGVRAHGKSEISKPQSLIPNPSVARPHPNPLPAGEGTGWEVRITVRFDDAGDALASHRQWIFDNPAYLEGRDGKRVACNPCPTVAQSRNEVGLAYQFRTEQPLENFTFVYQTPGTIVTRAFEYELRDIRLP